MNVPMTAPLPDRLGEKKVAVAAWFAELQDHIITAFEAIEDQAPALYGDAQPGRFERRPWKRTDRATSGVSDAATSNGTSANADFDSADGGGGTMAMMHGRVFEKVGVHVSTVHGEFSPELAMFSNITD